MDKKGWTQIGIAAAVLAVGLAVGILGRGDFVLSFVYGTAALLSGGVLWLVYRLLFRNKQGEILIGVSVIAALGGAFLLINRWFRIFNQNVLCFLTLAACGVIVLLVAFLLKDVKSRNSLKFFAISGGVFLAALASLVKITLSFTALCLTAAAILVWFPIEQILLKRKAEKEAGIITVKEKDIEIIDDEEEK